MHRVLSSKAEPLHQMWRDLGVVHKEQMLALSPADAKLSREFIHLLTGEDMSGAMSLKRAEMDGHLS